MSVPGLMQGDCLDLLGSIEPGSIDAIITDLPYGTTACEWDSIIPLEPLWAEVRRVLQPRGVFVTTASQPFTSALVMSNLPWFRYCWIWEKNTGTRFLNAKTRPLLFHEDVAVFYDQQPTYNPQRQRGLSNHTRSARSAQPGTTEIYRPIGPALSDVSGSKYPRTVLRFDTPAPSTKTDHPTEKPVALMQYLIQTYTNPGDVVLDPAMGSGTTGVACMRVGRSFIGMERDARYFKIAIERIQSAFSQTIMPLERANSA